MFIEDVLNSYFELKGIDIQEGTSHRPILLCYQELHVENARRVSEQGYEKDEERVDICQRSRKTPYII